MKCVFCSYRYCKIHATYMDISIQSRHAEITGGSGSAPLPMYVVINNKYMLYFTISVRTVIMKSSQPKMTNHIADDFIILPTPFVVEVCVWGGGAGCSETNNCHSLLVIGILNISVISIITSVITTVIITIIIKKKWEEEAAPLDSSDYNFRWQCLLSFGCKPCMVIIWDVIIDLITIRIIIIIIATVIANIVQIFTWLSEWWWRAFDSL